MPWGRPSQSGPRFTILSGDSRFRLTPRGEGPLRHLVAPDILERRLIRGPAEEDRELLDEANIVVLGRRLKLTDRHILDHAPAQRAYGRIGHEVLLSEWRLAITHPQTGRRRP